MPQIHVLHRCGGAVDVGWLASGPLTCRQLQVRDGDKSQLRDKGILESRAQHHRCHRTRVAGYGRLGTGRNKSTRTMVETPDGAKNDRYWSRANSSANAALAISMKVCRAGAAENGVFPYTYISTLTGKPTDKLMMPRIFFQRDQWWKSHRQLLGVLGVLDCVDGSRQCCGGHDR